MAIEREPVPTTSAEQSVWLEDLPRVTWPPLEHDLAVDVAVVGAGITGAMSALLLKRDGARVALLEADRVGGGVTGCTTAKVTALQATMYSTIRRHHGHDAAAAYADASLAGVERVAEVARMESIECDLSRRPAFTYASKEQELEAVEREGEAARAAGLDAVTTTEVDLPYPVAGAVRLDDQIAFHPVRFVRGLAAAVDGGDSMVAEGTRVLGVEEGAPCRVHTSRGTIAADRVVIASHYPLLDRGMFFARLEPQRSYCIAARVRGPLPKGMSISAGEPTRSVRSHDDLLIVGGEGHTTGAARATPERYQALERFARAHWDVDAVTHRWSAQDPVPYDLLPVVGRYTPRSSRLYVASGFMKWGLSGGAMAAILLSDLIAGRENRWAAYFNPNRLPVRLAPKLIRLNTKVALDLVGDHLRPPDAHSAAEVAQGASRRHARWPREKGPLPRRERGAPRCVASLHPPWLPASLQFCRTYLGLPMPRISLRRRRSSARGPGGQAPSASLSRRRILAREVRRAP